MTVSLEHAERWIRHAAVNVHGTDTEAAFAVIVEEIDRLRAHRSAALALADELDEQAAATIPDRSLVDEDEAAEAAYDSGAADALESAALRLRAALGEGQT